jgi:hypothetical protein
MFVSSQGVAEIFAEIFIFSFSVLRHTKMKKKIGRTLGAEFDPQG